MRGRGGQDEGVRGEGGEGGCEGERGEEHLLRCQD